MSRRRFFFFFMLLGGVAAPFLVPGSALGLNRAVSPSNRITLGFAGVGCQNRGLLAHSLQFDDVQVIAVSDPDKWRRENGQTTVETRYAQRKESGEFKGCDSYRSFHEMLDRPDIDGIVMALGEQWHGPAVIMATKAGKDVYVEKPSTFTIREALDQVEAVRRHGTVCQVGYQQRNSATFAFACRLAREGALGKIDRIYILGDGPSIDIELPAEPTPETLDWDLWLGPAPWRPFSHRLHYLGNPLNVVPWHFCKDVGLGILGSNASHAFDVVHWGLGLDTSGPEEIIPPNEQSPFLTFIYPNDVTLQLVHGRLNPDFHDIPAGFDPITTIQHFGAVFVGDKGWVHVGRLGYLKCSPAEIAKDRPGPSEEGFSHVRDWLDCMKLRKRPACDIEIGSHSSMDSVLGNIAHWLKRPLKWDAAKHEFIGDEVANRLRSRAYRHPWII
jgi:hypothetical protein